MNNVYELSNEQLIKEVWRKLPAVGVSNSGLLIDSMAGVHLVEAHIIMSALRARLDGAKPPFLPGDKVILKGHQPTFFHFEAPPVEPEKTYTILAVWYKVKVNEDWFISLEEFEYDERGYHTGLTLRAQYPASLFRKTT